MSFTAHQFFLEMLFITAFLLAATYAEELNSESMEDVVKYDKNQVKFYNYEDSICCDGEIYNKSDRANKFYSCCGKEAYYTYLGEKPEDFINPICCNDTLRWPDNDHSDCCDSELIDTHEVACDNGKKIFIEPEDISNARYTICHTKSGECHFYNDKENDCCGGDIYNPTTEYCCTYWDYKDNESHYYQEVIPLVEGVNSSEAQCCKGQVFNMRTQICCNDNIIDNKGFQNGACCGDEVYDSTLNQTCCNEKIIEHKGFRYGLCCGDEVSDYTLNQTCCNDKIIEHKGFRYGACCGDEVYDSTLNQTCCNNKIIEHKGFQTGACCGDEVYDYTLNQCSKDNKIESYISNFTEDCYGVTYDYRTQVCWRKKVLNKPDKNSVLCDYTGEFYDGENPNLLCTAAGVILRSQDDIDKNKLDFCLPDNLINHHIHGCY